MSSKNHKFVEREKLLRDAFIQSQVSGEDNSSIRLDKLVSLMKTRSKYSEFLSSIYFAGGEGDHPYFLLNDNVALGLSVLPEDAEKAGKTKRHPHQYEVLVVIDGSIKLEIGRASCRERV